MSEQKRPLIEAAFPCGPLSIIAEQESWRKEVNRPASYIHKWWARRLGSVFRGLIIGSCEKEGSDFFEKYYGPTDYPQTVVFDPFMGSGTTVHEALKLGAKAIGSDINPVAAALVRTAVENYSREEILQTFDTLSSNCQDEIKKYYKGMLNGTEVDVLYYFWVMTLDCPCCGTSIPLMKSSIFSKNAYASKKPEAKSVCPFCNHINTVLYNDTHATCDVCRREYNPQAGNVKGIEYICPSCGNHGRIVDYMRAKKRTPSARMYAKMVIDSNGMKHYVDIDAHDIDLYKAAQADLPSYTEFIPNDEIQNGINTAQILNYQYRYWKDMFNSRQLLAFGILSKEINKISDPRLRRLFAVLMSGTLEFNNMFCSFKGEGTGAVRPLFYNHILKNELMPLEANPWGCKASSGSFSTLFATRIMRMLEYKEHPFELKPLPGKKSEKIEINSRQGIRTGSTEAELEQADAIILCKDSAKTSIPTGYVDLVVTDPPFFDNVNYSELADFFYAWLRKLDIGVSSNTEQKSTRNAAEVQDNDPDSFSSKLGNVFSECNRVLKHDGLLVFTYHHSRTEGWVSVFNAIHEAGFYISEVFPVKAEMAVSVAIMAAKEPINYDLVFVCRKKDSSFISEDHSDIIGELREGVHQIEANGLLLSSGDIAIFQYGLALKHLSAKGLEAISKSDIEEILSITQSTPQQINLL